MFRCVLFNFLKTQLFICCSLAEHFHGSAFYINLVLFLYLCILLLLNILFHILVGQQSVWRTFCCYPLYVFLPVSTFQIDDFWFRKMIDSISTAAGFLFQCFFFNPMILIAAGQICCVIFLQIIIYAVRRVFWTYIFLTYPAVINLQISSETWNALVTLSQTFGFIFLLIQICTVRRGSLAIIFQHFLCVWNVLASQAFRFSWSVG